MTRPSWNASRINTIRAGETAYSIVTIAAVGAMSLFLYLNYVSRLFDEMGVLVEDRLKTWNQIIDLGGYLNRSGDVAPRAPQVVAKKVQLLIGELLDSDTKFVEQLDVISRKAQTSALGYLFAGEIAFVSSDGIDATARNYFSELRSTPPELIEARTSALESSTSILIFSRKMLQPQQQRESILRTVRSRLTSLRTSIEWILVILLPISIWGVWLTVLRPRLLQSLDLQSRIEISERRARATLSSIGEAVVVVGAGGTVSNLNPAAEALFGVGRDKVLGCQLERFIQLRLPSTLSGTQLLISDLVGGGKPASRHVEDVRLTTGHDDTSRSFSLTVAPVAYPGEAGQGVVLVLRDTTQQEKLREEMHGADKARALVGLAAGLAHEFNNALAVISGARELMALKLRQFDDPAQRVDRHLKAIEGAIRQSSGLTEQLLSIGSQSSLKLSEIDIMEPLRDIVRPLQEIHNHSAEFVLHSNLKASETFILGNATSLRRAFMNLGRNSLQAKAKLISVTISFRKDCHQELLGRLVRSDTRRPYVVIEWRDDGTGIPEADLERVFEPFFTTRTQEGSPGLGLSIVRGIIVEHRGAVVASAAPGGGALFTIYLPAVEPMERAALPAQRRPEGMAASMRALIVEDEVEYAATLQEYLSLNGVEVDVANTGSEAIELFESAYDKIDIVLLDINLHGMSGFEVEARMRALKPECRIIISTGNLGTNSGDVTAVDDVRVVLQKPYAFNELLETMRGMCK